MIIRALVVVAIVLLVLLLPRWWRVRSKAAEARKSDFAPLPMSMRGAGRTWVVFTSRFCARCGPLADWLRSTHAGDDVLLVDAELDARLAATYAVRSTPTVLVASSDGIVEARLVGVDAVQTFARA